MTDGAVKRDVEAVYALAAEDAGLAELMEAICGVLSRHERALAHLTHSYRLIAGDTGYRKEFALRAGRFFPLDAGADADVTVIGTEETLRRVFRRELTPLAALLRGQVKIKGDRGALLALAAFL